MANKSALVIKTLLFMLPFLSACDSRIEVNGRDIAAMRASFFLSGNFRRPLSAGLQGDCENGSSETGTYLYALNSRGERSEEPLRSGTINASGDFQIDVYGLDERFNDSIKYIIDVVPCGEGQRYSRPVTGSESQDVDSATTLISLILELDAEDREKITSMPPNDLAAYLNELSEQGDRALGLYENFKRIVFNPTLKEQFSGTFGGIPPEKLGLAPPRILQLNIPNQLVREGQSHPHSVSVAHWNPSYQIAYIWKLNNDVVSTGSQFTYTPGANEQGIKTLSLYLGALDASSQQLDVRLPFIEKSTTLTVDDAIPATPLAFRAVGDSLFTTTRNLELALDTGANLSKCKSFSTLALSENDAVAPEVTEFQMECNTPGSQALEYKLTSDEDGVKTLRLWAKDASGNISKTPSTLTINLDTTLPVVSLEALPLLVKGGSSINVGFNAVDVNGIKKYLFEYAADGVTFSSIDAVASASTSATVLLPMDNTSTARVRVTVTDAAGHSARAISHSFTVDSLGPAVPGVALHSPSKTNSQNILLSVDDCADVSKVLVTEGAKPGLSDAGWQACRTEVGAISYSLQGATNGERTLKVWAQDAAGNMSLASRNVVLIFDNAPPNLVVTAPAGPFGANEVLTFSWKITEPHIDASAQSEISYFDGSDWHALPSQAIGKNGPLSNEGFSYSWTTPSLSTSSARFRVTVLDDAGNVGTATSTPFAIDTTPPVISKFEVNNGDSNAGGNTLALIIDAADQLTSIAGYQFSLSNNFTGVSWIDAPPTVYTFPFSSQTYTLYVRVRDQVGNITTASSAPVKIIIGAPPVINVVLPDGSEKFVAAEQDVHIAWSTRLTSGTPIRDDGVNIFYSLDGGDTKEPWPGGSDLGSSANGSCVLAAGQDGCVRLPLPAELENKRFQIIISAEDAASNTGIVKSRILNVNNKMTLFAGRDSYVLGGTALATSLTYHGGLARDPVNGDIYLANRNQILKVVASTGKIDHWAGDRSNKAPTSAVGDGLPLSSARFSMTDQGGARGQMVVDSKRNVYWCAANGIWKFDFSTGIASVFVGAVESPTSGLTGVHRRSFQPTGQIVYLRLGQNDRLYFLSRTSSSIDFLYRVEADETITHIAGTNAAGAPQPSEGISALSAKVHGISVIPGKAGSSDRIFTTFGLATSNNGLWEITPEGKLTLKKSGIGSDLGAYLHSRGVIPMFQYGTGMSTIRFVNPDDPAAVFANHSAYDASSNSARSIVDDGAGGYFYTTNDGRIVSYVDAANVRHDFAGTEPWHGNGVPATEAELRGPRQITLDTEGNYYIFDRDNARVRKIDSSGVITNRMTGLNNDVLVSGIAPGEPYLFRRNFGRSLKNLNGTCIYFCGNASKSVVTAVDDSSNPDELSADQYPTIWISDMIGAWDNDDLYVHMVVSTSSTHHSAIKKIDSNNYMSTIAGGASLAAKSSTDTLAFAAGTIPMEQHAGYITPGPAATFFVSMGTVFLRQADGHIYSFESGQNWVKQTTASVSNFIVGQDRAMFFIRDLSLIRKSYSSSGNGAEVVVADFQNELKAPVVRSFAHDVEHSHAILISDGNQIYRYENSVHIP